jgi:hypothetical protein
VIVAFGITWRAPFAVIYMRTISGRAYKKGKRLSWTQNQLKKKRHNQPQPEIRERRISQERLKESCYGMGKHLYYVVYHHSRLSSISIP